MHISDKINMSAEELIANGPITIVAFGDSVTHGAVAPGEINYETVYWNRLRQKLNAVRNYVPVNVINAGIGGITAKRSLDRIDRDVLKHEPDLVIVCFGLNDVNGTLEDFVESLRVGYRCLMRSADLAGYEEEPSAFEKKLIDKFGKKASDALTYLAMLIGVVAAVLLFMVLPAFLVGLLGDLIPDWSRTILEGVLKITLFVLYLAVVSRSKDMHRMFQYHGAEHKTIACYEAGEELTPENVKKYTRFHPRCGTSFLLIVLVVSVLVFSFVTWNSLVIRVLLKLILLPVTVGISFEIIRYAGRYSNPLTRLISAPGLWLQRLTTAEPDTEHIEVAIASMLPCIPSDGSDQWGN